MKFFIVLSLALFAITQAYPTNGVQDQLHLPEKCSDVLAVKVCDRLDRMATALKLKSEEVKLAVIKAYTQGKTKSEEIYDKAREILASQVLSKTCEDFMTKENCLKLEKLAADLKVQAAAKKQFIMEQIAELKTKDCEDFLDAKQCAKLNEVAGKLKIRADKLKEMMIESYLEYKTKATDMVTETYEKVRAYVQATRCEDMFNPNVCVAFRRYAKQTKVALPVIMETAYNLVVKGVEVSKTLIEKTFDIVDFFYDCTDVFDQSSCDRINAAATKASLAFKKYMRIAIEKGTDVYTKAKEMIAKMKCWFSSSCTNDEDIGVMEDDVAYGIFDRIDVVKEKLRKFIKERFPQLEDKVRAKLLTAINKAQSKFQIMIGLAKATKNEISGVVQKLILRIMTEVYN